MIMIGFRLNSILLGMCILIFFSNPLYAYQAQNNPASDKEAEGHKNKKLDIVIRLGQGGFRGDRSPLDKLGGGLSNGVSTNASKLSLKSFIIMYFCKQNNECHF